MHEHGFHLVFVGYDTLHCGIGGHAGQWGVALACRQLHHRRSRTGCHSDLSKASNKAVSEIPMRVRAGSLGYALLDASGMDHLASSDGNASLRSGKHANRVPGKLVLLLGSLTELMIIKMADDGTVFDAKIMAEDVRDLLTQLHGSQGLGRVRCPPGQRVKARRSFQCVVAIDRKSRQ